MLDTDFVYDDRDLQRLYEDLQPKRRLQALKGAFRKEAKVVRKSVIKHLRNSVKSNADLEKGVRSLSLKKKAGFRVTIGTKLAKKNGKGEAGFHANRQGLKKPVLIWVDAGTKTRKTKSNGRRRFSRKRAAHSTGQMRAHYIISKAMEDVKDTVTRDLHQAIIEEIQRVSKKYGCN